MTGALHVDHRIAWIAHDIGALTMAGGLIAAGAITWKGLAE